MYPLLVTVCDEDCSVRATSSITKDSVNNKSDDQGNIWCLTHRVGNDFKKCVCLCCVCDCVVCVVCCICDCVVTVLCVLCVCECVVCVCVFYICVMSVQMEEKAEAGCWLVFVGGVALCLWVSELSCLTCAPRPPKARAGVARCSLERVVSACARVFMYLNIDTIF